MSAFRDLGGGFYYDPFGELLMEAPARVWATGRGAGWPDASGERGVVAMTAHDLSWLVEPRRRLFRQRLGRPEGSIAMVGVKEVTRPDPQEVSVACVSIPHWTYQPGTRHVWHKGSLRLMFPDRLLADQFLRRLTSLLVAAYGREDWWEEAALVGEPPQRLQ